MKRTIEIPMPFLHLPSHGRGSPGLNRLVAEGKLKFDPATGKFSKLIQIEEGEMVSFTKNVKLVSKPYARSVRLLPNPMIQWGEIHRNRPSDQARKSYYKY